MSPQHETIITPNKSVQDFWRELWDYRDLFYFLAWRDLKVRYKQTVIGVAWAVLRPLTTMLVFTVLFSRIAKLPTEGAAPYPVLVFAAMLPWQFFASCLQDSSQSLVNNANMLSKVYFPRIIIPVSTMFVNAVDFLISLAILFALMALQHFTPTAKLLWMPLFFAQAALAAIGAGLWLAALNVSYRDFRYVVPFVLQLGLYVSPVGFSSRLVPEDWRLAYALNPMVGVIDGFRWSLLDDTVTLDGPTFQISLAVTVLLFASGLRHFQKVERRFADVI
ncbi:MAG: ABC transporter permease [Candidatus Methylumidiphilus sp.]